MPDAPLPPNALSERQLRFGIWMTAHRALFRRIGIGALIAVAAGSWLFTIWGIVDHVFLSGAALQRSLAELAAPENPRIGVIRQERPQPLTVAEAVIVPSGPGSYDLAVRVVNPNTDYRANVIVSLDVPGAAGEPSPASILPGRDRWLTRLNVAATSPPSAVTPTFSRIAWNRVPRQTGPDVDRYIRERLDLAITDVAYVAAGGFALGTSGEIGAPILSRATFRVTNRSAYGFLLPEFTVLLRRSGAIVGVNRVTLAELASGATADVAATWYHPIGLVTGAPEVIPFVDVFAPSSFLPI